MQGLLALGTTFMVLVLVVGQEKFSSGEDIAIRVAANLMVLFTISVQVGLIVGIQLRQQWARWIAAGVFGLSLITNAFRLSTVADDELVGFILGMLLAAVTSARFTFGAPSRRYFAKELVANQ